MSYCDYVASRVLGIRDASFDALIMAAMRKADTFNLFQLQMAFPAIWAELEARYNAPGGKLEGEM